MKPFQVSSPWSVSPPSQYRFAGVGYSWNRGREEPGAMFKRIRYLPTLFPKMQRCHTGALFEKAGEVKTVLETAFPGDDLD